LLLASAGSISAVFLVHGIEASGGPLSQPSATRFFSPGSSDRGPAIVRFTTRNPETVTVRILDADTGSLVRTLMEDELVDGTHQEPWDGNDDDGTPVRDGEYVVRIRRAGDGRSYGPTAPIIVDTVPPAAVLDAARTFDGELRGLALLEDKSSLVLLDIAGERLPGLRFGEPHPNTPTLTPRTSWPDGALLVRFIAELDTRELHDVQLAAVDAAGNRTELLEEAARARIESAS